VEQVLLGKDFQAGMQLVMRAVAEEQDQQDHLVLRLVKAAPEHYGRILEVIMLVAAAEQPFSQQ
jgi:hypothetical protein